MIDSFLSWEFEKQGNVLRVHVQGQCAFNIGSHILQAALAAGGGLAYLPEDVVISHINSGKLVAGLED